MPESTKTSQKIKAVLTFDMPKSCAACPVWSNRHEGWCRIPPYPYAEAPKYERPENCPIVPHLDFNWLKEVRK